MIDRRKIHGIYSALLSGWESNRADLGRSNLTTREKMQHIVAMLQSILIEKDSDKMNRWLGFVQGVLWAYDYCSIDDLRKHIISCNIQSDQTLVKCGLVEPDDVQTTTEWKITHAE